MLISKTIKNIEMDVPIGQGGYRSCAFGVYLNLLNTFNSKQLNLLESLGRESIDSRTSLIGIAPVFKLEVFDRIVTISAGAQLLECIQSFFQGELLLDTSANALKYQLTERKAIWGFLRVLDAQFEGKGGGVFAFTTFAYNTIFFIEDIAGYIQGNTPDISLTCYSACLEFDDDGVRLHEYKFIGSESINLLAIADLLAYQDCSLVRPANCDFLIDRETLKNDYLQKAEAALRHIQIGNVYQIQIGQKISVRMDVSTLDVYARLRLFNPSPYMYLFDCGQTTVIGASPELFIYMKDDEVLMRPIAGTLGKSVVPSKEDAAMEFQQNSKEIAEHLMLVDLCRNDLCRVSMPDSVMVSDLMTVEEYSHVYHMVSTTKAHIQKNLDKFDVIQAAFPAGTMTGAPKIKAIELIAQIEDSGRGLYAGALGVIGLGVNFINTALCIRTATECDGVFTLRASAGIVADSVIDGEYAETLHKMGSVFKAITDEEITCHVV